MNPRTAFPTGSLLLTALLGSLTSCASLSPELEQCRLVGGRGTWHGEFYVATVLLENSNSKEVDLRDVQFELITYDSDDQIVQRRQHRMLGTVRALQRDRIPIDILDREHAVENARVILKDSRGRQISECFIRGAQLPDSRSSDTPPPST